MADSTRRIVVSFGDILEFDVDAIVNPAHEDLLGGGGLDGMIHDAAGPQMLEACRQMGRCSVGDARTTPGFELRARWVIHTVGPIWRGGAQDEERLLASCYRRCLEEAAIVGARTVAFPGISTGLHRFPVGLAAQVAIREVREFIATASSQVLVTIVAFDNSTMNAYESALAISGTGRTEQCPA